MISKTKITQNELNAIAFHEWAKGKTADIKLDSNGNYVMDTMPFRTEFAKNAQDRFPYYYKEGGKVIKFHPTEVSFIDNSDKVISILKTGAGDSNSVLSEDKFSLKYSAALGAGIDIDVSTSETGWKKIITIDSLAALKTIPIQAKYLEISFEIETDFAIEGWDGKSDYVFTNALKLGDNSKIEAVKVWDSYVFTEQEIAEADREDLIREERCEAILRVRDGKKYFVKRIPVDYLKNAAYPIYTDTEIAYGSEYTFYEVSTESISVAELDATHFVVAFMDGVSGYGNAMIGVVSSGDQIAYGSEYAFNEAYTEYISVAALDATHFVVAFMDGGSSSYGIAMIGVVSSEDQIAYGSEYAFHEAITNYISAAALDATHFVVAFMDGGDGYGIGMIGVVSSGNQIAYGSEYAFHEDSSNYISAAAVDATHFVVAFTDGVYGIAMIGVVSSGNQIAYGSEYAFNEAYTEYISVAALDATHFVVAFMDGGSSSYGIAMIGVVSSEDQIAYGSEYAFHEAITNYISAAALDATHFVVAFMDSGGSSYGIAMIGVVSSEDQIAYGSEYAFNEASTEYISAAALDAAHFVVAFKDSGGSSYGIAMIGVVSLPPPAAAGGTSPAAKLIAAGFI